MCVVYSRVFTCAYICVCVYVCRMCMCVRMFMVCVVGECVIVYMYVESLWRVCGGCA